MAIDPVCGMTVEPEKAKGISVYNGSTIYFCAPNCKKRFDSDPEAFMARVPSVGHSVDPVKELSEETAVVDPVCGMTVKKAKAAGTSVYMGASYYFCNVNCKTKFDGDPGKYLSPDKARAMQ